MSDLNKRRLAYGILILAIVLAGLLGVQYPIPAPPDGTFGGILEPAPVVRGSGYFARFTQPVQFKQTLTVDGASTLTGAVAVTGAQTNAGALTVTGATALNGGLTMDTNKFTVADGTGNTVIAGTLGVTRAQTNSAALTVNNNATVTGTLTVGSDAFSGAIKYGATNTVVSGTLIAHGLSGAPTAILLTPKSTGVFTDSVFVLASNATSFTVGISDSVSIETLYWMAGK
jgi:hypothetical protein